ncbi:MAG: response regulator [Verrucomicrobiota bacterium]
MEDDKSDREIVRLALANAEIDFEFFYAASRSDFSTALEAANFDLILADFTLPGYDGAKALSAAQEKCPDVPFLFVSGTIGEEQAVECLRRGAADYVLKDRLTRLLPAIRRALSEAEMRARHLAAENALRHSEARFRAMAASVEHVFWIAGAGAREFLYVSPAYEHIWGRPVADLYAQPTEWLAAIVPNDRPEVRDAREQLAAGKEYRVEYRIRHPDGSVRWIEDRGYPLRESGEMGHLVGVAMDITRRKHLEAQLLQAQKMEAVGQLAGGIAHDFNNMLTVINGYARLLLDAGTLTPEANHSLTQIYNAGVRASNLTRQLLVFSRKHSVERRAVDLNGVVDEIATMLRRVIGEHIGLKLKLAAAPAMADADPGMIEQVLMNLAVNARDAMTGGGELTIGTEPIAIEDAATRHHTDARPGEFICLSVRDTGSGISPENLPRIFEPFFTTKDVGRGTGLGLAMVFGIVQQHKGWVEVESTVGAGTCFRVLLPTAQGEAATASRNLLGFVPVRGGNETMLLVEDDATVREFAVAVLRAHGYRVLQAASGVDALEVWKWHQSRITLLFSDLVLPDGLGGVELAGRLRQAKPTLKVVLTSGYAGETIGEEFRPPPGTHFIHKPYKPQVLTEAVRDALDDNFNR